MSAKPGNQTTLKHGGEGAIKAIQHGTEFTATVKDAENDVRAELESVGSLEMIRKNAIRLQTACDLFWGAVLKAASEGDIPHLNGYLARFGWLAGVSLRAWSELAKLEHKAKRQSLNEMLGKVKDG